MTIETTHDPAETCASCGRPDPAGELLHDGLCNWCEVREQARETLDDWSASAGQYVTAYSTDLREGGAELEGQSVVMAGRFVGWDPAYGYAICNDSAGPFRLVPLPEDLPDVRVMLGVVRGSVLHEVNWWTTEDVLRMTPGEFAESVARVRSSLEAPTGPRFYTLRVYDWHGEDVRELDVRGEVGLAAITRALGDALGTAGYILVGRTPYEPFPDRRPEAVKDWLAREALSEAYGRLGYGASLEGPRNA